MKTLLKVFITLSLVISLLGSVLLTIRNGREAGNSSENAAVEAIGGLGGLHSLIGDMPSAGEWQTGMILSVLLLISSLVGIVATYLKNNKIGLIVAGLIGVSAVLLMILQPALNGALLQDNNPKPVANVVCIIGIIGAIMLGALKGVLDKPKAAQA